MLMAEARIRDRRWYHIIWYDMVWFGMVWFGMVWYGLIGGGGESADCSQDCFLIILPNLTFSTLSTLSNLTFSTSKLATVKVKV